MFRELHSSGIIPCAKTLQWTCSPWILAWSPLEKTKQHRQIITLSTAQQ